MSPELEARYAQQVAGIRQRTAGKGSQGGIPQGAIVAKPITPTRIVQQSGGFFDYAGRVASQAAGIIGQGVAQAASFVANTPKYIYQGVEPFLRPVADVLTGSTSRDLANINKLSAQLDENARRYNEAYRSGKMSKEHYKNLLLELSRSYSDLSKRAEGVASFAKEQGDPKRVLKGAAETAATILSGGRWVALKGGKPVVQSVVAQNINKVAGKFETALERIPAFRELVARNLDKIATQNAKRLAGETTAQFMARNSKDLAIGLLLKRPIIYQTNIGEAEDIYTGMAMGDYGEVFSSTGWIASQMIGGGPIGWFVRHGKKAGIKLRELSRGRGSLLDEISKRIGNGNPAQAARYLNILQEKAPETFKKHEEVARIMQETNLRVANERVADAAENILSTYDQAGIARENISFGMILRDYQRWAEAADIADSLKGRKIPGLDEYQVDNLVVIRWDSIMKRGLAEGIQQAGNDKQAMVAVLNEFAQRTANGWGNNPNLMRQLTRIIDESASAEEAARRIKAIPTATAMPDGLPKLVAKRLAKLGYGVAVPLGGVRRTPIVKLEDTRKLITGAIRGNTEVFDEATEPLPVLRAIAGALDKMGLSPQGANQVANQSLRQSLAASLSETEIGRVLGIADHNGDVTKGGAAVLSRLQKYVETKKPIWVLGKLSSGKSAVTDVRMLRVGEIAEALGVSKTQAKEVQRALLDAYIKVPLELRGLGDRIVDYNFKFNPAQKYYARIQSALRYTYNPFFRFQEQVETAALSKMNADKFLWLQSKEKLNEGVEKLTRAGFFEGNLTSAAADDVVFGRISANLTKFQKRNLAGLAQTLADRKGISLDDMIRNYPEELDDALRVIVQYPNKGVLSSALGRTLNVAFFPMRYNAKVTMLAAKKIAELPPSVQLGVIQGFMKMKDWLQSDEGIRWQSEHADAIKVFKWATPVGSIESFYKVATGNVEAPGDLGLLGGLPFGVISQVLDSQGIINLNTPYINPATGDQFPDYIPQTTRARAAVAVQDLLGSMFTFPGRTLGMVGKEATLRDAVGLFIDTNGADFEKRLDPNLTPLQKKWVEVLKGDTSEDTINSLYTSPADGQFNYYTIPPFDLPIVRPPTTPIKPIERRTGLPSKGSGGKTRPQPIPRR